jgi:hypothetical protein
MCTTCAAARREREGEGAVDRGGAAAGDQRRERAAGVVLGQLAAHVGGEAQGDRSRVTGD